jgi:hypothetical protein
MRRVKFKSPGGDSLLSRLTAEELHNSPQAMRDDIVLIQQRAEFGATMSGSTVREFPRLYLETHAGNYILSSIPLLYGGDGARL